MRASKASGKLDAKLAARARRIARALIAEYPDARCMLDHQDAFQLLVATILAAQCTDERVNKVTPTLFRRFTTAASMARAGLVALEDLIRSTGFFHNKAKSIKGASEALAKNFPGGFLPAWRIFSRCRALEGRQQTSFSVNVLENRRLLWTPISGVSLSVSA